LPVFFDLNMPFLLINHRYVLICSRYFVIKLVNATPNCLDILHLAKKTRHPGILLAGISAQTRLRLQACRSDGGVKKVLFYVFHKLCLGF